MIAPRSVPSQEIERKGTEPESSDRSGIGSEHSRPDGRMGLGIPPEDESNPFLLKMIFTWCNALSCGPEVMTPDRPHTELRADRSPNEIQASGRSRL